MNPANERGKRAEREAAKLLHDALGYDVRRTKAGQFHDVGDLTGIRQRLGYISSLGVDAIWISPFFPSPMKDFGYDVTDYYGINPQYGTLADFDRLLAAAHQRGIKVIMDLVINHSSSEHPWFKAARDPASPYHDWYQWSDKHTNLAAISATGSPSKIRSRRRCRTPAYVARARSVGERS